MNVIMCISTVASAIIALIALFYSGKQISISNKQNLFDIRVRSYLIIHGLLELYIENKRMIEEEKDDEIYSSADTMLGFLTNNSYLEIMGNVINRPLHQEEQKEFLKKIEELKNEAEKSKLIFKEDVSIFLHEFIKAYEEVLMQLYKYIIIIEKIREYPNKIPIKKETKEIAEEIHEKKYREELFVKFDNLELAFNNMNENEIMNKIKDQIKLK